MMQTMDIYIFNNNCFSKVKTIILYIIVTVLMTGNTFLIDDVAALTDVIYFADTHIGEGCNSSISGYQINDTNCYSVQDLKLAVEKINDISERDKRIAFAILGGDVTSSAQQTEFKAAKIELDKLKIDYIPLLGNHDMWSYDEVKGDLTTKPVGDLLFASTFKDIFYKWKNLHKLNYANRTVW